MASELLMVLVAVLVGRRMEIHPHRFCQNRAIANASHSFHKPPKKYSKKGHERLKHNPKPPPNSSAWCGASFWPKLQITVASRGQLLAEIANHSGKSQIAPPNSRNNSGRVPVKGFNFLRSTDKIHLSHRAMCYSPMMNTDSLGQALQTCRKRQTGDQCQDPARPTFGIVEMSLGWESSSRVQGEQYPRTSDLIEPPKLAAKQLLTLCSLCSVGSFATLPETGLLLPRSKFSIPPIAVQGADHTMWKSFLSPFKTVSLTGKDGVELFHT